MKLSKRIKIKLFTLLIALNIILRIPFFPHEYGMDSFVIHALANSVSTFGRAEWWLSPLSIFGLYPYSECSAVPFVLSGISQTIGIDMEKVILLFCITLGLFTVFAAYIMAGQIIDDDLYKFLVAFGFSLSPAILNYLTWTIAARAPFIALLPLFVYSLLKCRTYKLRYGFSTLILFVLLFATHHLVYFLIPVFIGYFIVVISYKLKSHSKFKSIKIPEKYITFALIIAFLVMFAIPFQTRRLLEVGSRYEAVNMLFFGNLPRYAGVLGVFAIGGFAYLLFKSNKRFEEWSLLFIMLFLMPLLYVETYMKWFIPCFILLLGSIGLINILKSEGKKRKYAILVVISFLLLSVSFSSFYQHWRTGGGGVKLFDNYMKESTYIAGLWVKENVVNGLTISNDVNTIGIRAFAVSGVPHLTGYYNSVDLAYGLFNVSELKLVKKSITEEDYWFNGPYGLIGGYSSGRCWGDIIGNSYEYYESRYRSEFNFTHFVENKKIDGRRVFGSDIVYPSPFLDSIHEEKECVYDNGNVRIWDLKQ